MLRPLFITDFDYAFDYWNACYLPPVADGLKSQACHNNGFLSEYTCHGPLLHTYIEIDRTVDSSGVKANCIAVVPVVKATWFESRTPHRGRLECFFFRFLGIGHGARGGKLGSSFTIYLIQRKRAADT
jgi:hypothetical protein